MYTFIEQTNVKQTFGGGVIIQHARLGFRRLITFITALFLDNYQGSLQFPY